jgi:hypothetical protein
VEGKIESTIGNLFTVRSNSVILEANFELPIATMKMNKARRSVEAVGCQNAFVGGHSALEGSNRKNGGR